MRVCRCAESYEPSPVVYEVNKNLMGLYFFSENHFLLCFVVFATKKQ